MNCQEVKELLSAYIDQELTRTETREVTNHLKACQDCTRELVTFRKLTGILHSLPEVKTPRWVWGSLAAAAAAVLLVVANFSFLSKETFRETTVTRIQDNGAETMSEDLFSSEPEKGLALTEKPAAPDSLNAISPKSLPAPTVTTSPPPSPPPTPVLAGKSSGRVTDKGGETNIHLKENSEIDSVNLKREADKKDRLTKKGKKITDQWGRQLKTKAGQTSGFVQTDRSVVQPQLLNLSQEVMINCADLTVCENQINQIISEESRKFQSSQQIIIAPGYGNSRQEPAELNENANDLKAAKAVGGEKQRNVRQLNFQVPLEQKEQVIDRLKKLGRVKVRQLNLPASPAGRPDAGRQNESFNQLTQLNQLTRQRLNTIKNETVRLQSKLSKAEKTRESKPTLSPKKSPDATGKLRAKAPSREESGDFDETQTTDELNFETQKLQTDRPVSQEKIVRELKDLENNLVKEYDLRQQQRALESLKKTNREDLLDDEYRWSDKEAKTEEEKKKISGQKADEYLQRQREAKQQAIQSVNQSILSETLINNLQQNSMVELIIILEEE
jgi:hypothetical protein